MQASTKDEVCSGIRKDNSGRFRLSCSSPLIKGYIYSQLGMPGEGVLADEILSNQANLNKFPVKEVIIMCITIIIEQCIEHWNIGKERTVSYYSRLYIRH